MDINVDVAFVDTGNEKRDNHLRSADFFNVEKFPNMRFVSTAVRRVKGNLRIVGRLTLHGVTQPVTLKVEGMSPAVVGPQWV